MNTLCKWILTLAIVWLALCTSVQAGEHLVETQFQEKLEQRVKQEALTGAVWATITEHEIATGAVGLANAQSKEAMSPNSKVQTASVVKTLIATGVLRLVTEEKLTLETPVATLLPDIVFDNPWASTDPVRVRHLLDHTSGLDDADLWQIMTVEAKPDTPLIDGMQTGPLLIRSRPGSRVSYSNQGYTLIGMLIEQVTGERYEHYLDTHFLRPLGMHMSTFKFVSQQGQHADSALAMGHFENGVTQATLPLYLRPAGQFTTTAKDMALFARFLMSKGELDGEVFIAEDLLNSMAVPVATEAAMAGLTEVGYALGMTSRDRHGVLGKCHNGSTVGFRTNFCVFPQQNKAFFVAFNADVETADYKRFDKMLIEQLGLEPLVPKATATPLANVSDWQGTYVLAPSRNESFAYLDYVLHFARLGWDGQALQLAPFQGKTKELVPVGDAFFRDKDRTQASHVLMTSADGKRIISDGFRTYQQISSWKIVPIWVSLVLGLLGIVWLFISGVGSVMLRKLTTSSALFVPFLSCVALLLPIPLFFSQSFLQLGDLTPASAVLSVVTALLPLAMIYGLWRSMRSPEVGVSAWLNTLAMLVVLQWCVVLAFWGLMPMNLWG
ncbi:serine hydrolase domain-containing protein [Pseudoalteromonas sp. T1lg48]|uniref:serine hydrolase domain-containing protein n=1 Tax=Pseudoalteromonas sp. T1lg48 TaxID=2077100 RepID=UPI000CF68709|nr:serine hydrolase domain-containing protein [Pseudoalteromonas sp. T1lg48]